MILRTNTIRGILGHLNVVVRKNDTDFGKKGSETNIVETSINAWPTTISKAKLEESGAKAGDEVEVEYLVKYTSGTNPISGKDWNKYQLVINTIKVIKYTK